MTPAPIAHLQRAADYGLTLAFEPPDTLTVEPVNRCPAEFGQLLKAHKTALLALLRLPFVMMFSKTLEELIFFCEDDDTKAALIEFGASEWSIYTRAELRILSEASRVAPFSDDDLLKVHQIKRTFNARIAP